MCDDMLCSLGGLHSVYLFGFTGRYKRSCHTRLFTNWLTANKEMRLSEPIDAKQLDIYLAQFSYFSNRPFVPPGDTDKAHRVQPTERTEHVVTHFLIHFLWLFT